jgi:hypothetical protein
MSLHRLVADIADALVALDSSRTPFKQFQPGVGPYGEPQLVRHVAGHLNDLDAYRALAASKRTPVSRSAVIDVKSPFCDQAM